MTERVFLTFSAAAILLLATHSRCLIKAANAPATQVSAALGELAPAEMRADFDLLRHALEEAHPGLYRYSTKAEMDRVSDAQRANLSRPMTEGQFEVVVAQTLASIRCCPTQRCASDFPSAHPGTRYRVMTANVEGLSRVMLP